MWDVFVDGDVYLYGIEDFDVAVNIARTHGGIVKDFYGKVVWRP